MINAATGSFIAGPFVDDQADMPDGAEWLEIADGWPDTLRYDAATRTFAPPPVTLTPRDVVGLYTPAERIRIFGSPVPEVRALYMMMQIMGVPIVVGSTEHVQGTALIAGLGLLDAPERAARIFAGMAPEVAP